MNIVRPFLHLLLSLALVASAVVPDVAADVGTAVAAIADAAPPCHGTGPESAESAPLDVGPGCCDEGACACDCLRHAPIVMVPVPRLLSGPAGPLISALSDRPSPDPAPLPSLRPPIA